MADPLAPRSSISACLDIVHVLLEVAAAFGKIPMDDKEAGFTNCECETALVGHSPK